MTDDVFSELKHAIRVCPIAPNPYYYAAAKNEPTYNSQFKKRVQELTITCAYNYETVYRVCSIFGITKAKDLLNTCYEVHIKYLLAQFWYIPYPMDADEEEAVIANLKYIDPGLPELFEQLLESSEYNSETLYQVFMSHGSGAKEIVEYAIENELMPYQLLRYSEKKLSESAEEAWNKLSEEIDKQPVIDINVRTRKNNKNKLPRNLRKGW
jgi:hypothetical protein